MLLSVTSSGLWIMCKRLQLFYRPQRSCGQGHVFTGGCLPQCMLGYHPPEQTPPGSRHTSPRSRHPPEQTPPQEQTPSGSRLWRTVNERPVRILLECILVSMLKCISRRYICVLDSILSLLDLQRPTNHSKWCYYELLQPNRRYGKLHFTTHY